MISLPQLPARLRDKIKFDPDTGCWLWTAAVNKLGYAKLNLVDKKPSHYAHRVLYEMYIGGIEKGMHLHHLCQTPCCVNPGHLQLLSAAEHLNLDNPNQFKEWTRCARGHEYTPQNTYIWRGERRCRTCGRDRMRAWRLEKKLRHIGTRRGRSPVGQLLYSSEPRHVATAR
jgi:HNH endonuclease